MVIFSLSVALLVKTIKFKRFARVNRLAFDETPCTANIPLGPFEGCSSFRINRAIRQNLPADCPWDTNYEIRLLTRTFSDDKANEVLTQLCQSAEQDMWESTPDMKWKHIDRNLKPDNIASFLHGHTELNTATGNLQNKDGTDPRNNEKYATDQFSFDVARNVRDFYESSASSVRLTDFPMECSAQTVMCCFRRDRQSGDQNGNCQSRNCTAAQPADNTNLCFHEDAAFPGDETIHCHGFTWNKDPSHFSHRLRSNTLFYVTMYDHWYTRGYVESVLPHAAPMCSCVEDMPTVVRADCTEIDMDTEYEAQWDQRHGLRVQPAGPLQYKFQNCQGTPINNDLSSKVKKMKELGDIDDQAVAVVQRHLVGHGDPENQVNEPACETAFELQRGKVYSTSSTRSVLTYCCVGTVTLLALVLLA